MTDEVPDATARVIFRTGGSPLTLAAVGLVFTAVGVWAVIVSIGYFPGLIICSLWLTGVVWGLGFSYAYDVTLRENGDIAFRALLRRRVLNVANVTKIKASLRGEGGQWIAVRTRKRRAWMPAGEAEVELVRRVAQMNPTVKIDGRIFE